MLVISAKLEPVSKVMVPAIRIEAQTPYLAIAEAHILNHFVDGSNLPAPKTLIELWLVAIIPYLSIEVPCLASFKGSRVARSPSKKQSL